MTSEFVFGSGFRTQDCTSVWQITRA